MTKQDLATEYVAKITNVIAEFTSEAKGTKGDIFDALAKKASHRIDILIRNFDVKFGAITE